MKSPLAIPRTIAITAGLFLADAATAQTLQEHWWVTDGTVNAIVEDPVNNVVYIGGDFTQVGPPVPYGAGLDATTGAPDLSFVQPSGTVNVTIPDGAGGWFIGGNFYIVGGQSRFNLARINADGSLNPWSAHCNGPVYALDLEGGVVYVGGAFSDVSGEVRLNMAAVDANTAMLLPLGGPLVESPTKAVLTLDAVGNTLYCGGEFTAVAPIVTYGAALSTTSGAPNLDYFQPNGAINVTITDGAGGWYIGGEFSQVGGQTRNRVARINADGSLHPWNPNASSSVYSLVLSGSMVYVGGWFSNIGGQARGRIAALDATTGLATTWNPNANSAVRAIAVSGSTVYVGGYFNNIGGQPRNRIAALDATTGLATTWNPDADNNVESLVVNGSTIYAGGYFNTIGGQTRNYIAALDANTGLPTTWNPNANNVVRALIVSGTTVYAGGYFTNIGGQTRSYIAALSSTSGNATAWNPIANSGVYTLAVSGSTVYAGGDYTYIGGQPRNRIAALSSSSPGNATTWNPDANGTVLSLAVSGTTVYAGGYFTGFTAGAQTRNYIAAFNATTGMVTTWNPNASETVRALTVSGSTIYAGGSFNTIGGQTRNYIAALSSSSPGTATTWNPNANSVIRALAVSGTTIYAGGYFSTIGGQTRNYIAALSGSTGNATTWNPDANNVVTAIVRSGTTVYAGGNFTNIGGQARNRIAALSSSSPGTATAWNPNATGAVFSLAVSGTTVYAGGVFNSIGAQPRNSIAALDATTGVPTAWNPDANNPVQSLAVSGTTVYAGGDFTNIGGQARNRVAALSASTGNATSWNPNSNSVVNSLVRVGTTVYAGGAFTNIGGQTRNRIAALSSSSPGNATTWNPNANNTVRSLVVSGTTVYAGGDFTNIGGLTRNRIAALSTSSGSASTWNPNANNPVRALALTGTTVYAGGDFTTIGGQTRNYIAALNATTGTATAWDPNASSTVLCLASSDSTIYAGGSFATIGGQYRYSIAALSASTGNANGWDLYANSTIRSLTLGASRLYAGGDFNYLSADPTRKGFAAFGLNTLSTGSVSSTLCANGQTNFGVPFNGTGSNYYPNTFTAQLSDASGVWASPTTIGSLNSTALSGTITASIPVATPPGNGYRIRVVASNPSVISNDNGTDLTVNLAPVVSCGGPYGPMCSNSSPITLGGSPSGGTWTGTGVSGSGPYTFNPSVGTRTLTYTYSNGTCATTCQTTITVNTAPTMSCGSYGPLCSNASPIILGGSPAGGTWTGTGVSGSGPYTFNPSMGTQTLTYTYNNGTCTNSCQRTITVYTAPTMSCGSYGPLCSNTSAITLGGTPSGGTWTGTGVSGTGPYTFNPSMGTQTLTYTYDNGTCPNSCQTTVSVIAPSTWYADTDGDTFGDPNDSQQACTQPTGYVADNTDQCPDDENKTAPGICGCGVADVSIMWYADMDGDGYGDPNNSQAGYTCIQPTGYVADNTDGCPDDENKIAPGICGCGVADEAITWYADTDGDGFGDPNSSQAGYTCIQPTGYVADNTDGCPDDENKIAPGICGCGVADEAITWYADTDGDGYGDPNSSQAGYTCIQPTGYVADNTDGCPDDENKIAPGICGCGMADVVITWYADTDGDGFGDPTNSQAGYTCIPLTGYVADNTDACPDDENKIAPGVCGCGVADVAITWYADTDGDGFGDPNSSQAGFTCIQPTGYVADNTDACPDDVNKIEPGICGCGVADVVNTWYADTDGDGYGDPNSSFVGCVTPGYVLNADDCNDTNPAPCNGFCVGTQNVSTNTGSCTYLHSGAGWDPTSAPTCLPADYLRTVFNVDEQGWIKRASGDAGSYIYHYDGTGSNHIILVEVGGGNLDWFQAPSIFLGNKAGFMNGSLFFQVKTNNTASPVTSQEHVQLVGGGVTIYATVAFPTTTFSDRSIPFSVGSWRISGGTTLATETQIRNVLTSLQAFYIRADWRSGIEETGLDHVRFYPGPPTYTLSGATAGVGTTLNGVSFQEGSTLVTWTFTDNCAGTSICAFEVDVESTTPWYADADGDGYGDPNVSELACTQLTGYVADNTDACPDDGNKIVPGICGCGVADTDTDNDGLADCVDQCPDQAGEIGSACDDGNANTANDVVNGSCQCAGTPVSGCTNDLVLELQSGNLNANAVTYEVLDATGTTTVLSGNNPVPSNSIGTQTLCLADGCYQLRVMDAAGDGLAGYVLRETGAEGRRIIDNTGNMTIGESQISSSGTFCVPISDIDLIWSSCDKLDWVDYKYLVCHANAAVSAEWVPNGANNVQDANSGYEFWIFDPNGSYSYRKFRSHNVSDGKSPANATRACHMKINNWYNSALTPLIPQNTLLNVRVRGRVNGVNQAFGPACTMKMDATRAACPLVKLQDDPSNTSDYSCGVTRSFGGSNSGANKITALPPQFSPAPYGGGTGVRFQFRFRIAAEGVCIVRPPQASPTLYLNWSAAMGEQLQATKTYEVEVRVSKDLGATWCIDSPSPACDPSPVTTWGKTCNVTISGVALQGGSSNMSTITDGSLTLYPNPNNGDQLFINLTEVSADVNTVSVDIYDLAGKRVSARTIVVSDGLVNTSIDINGELANGLYMVNITAGEKTYNERLVIQK